MFLLGNSWYGYFARDSSSRSIPKPGVSGRLMYPFSTLKGVVAISLPRSSKFTKYSVIRKFGVVAAAVIVAASRA